jgi:hypothetical protein
LACGSTGGRDDGHDDDDATHSIIVRDFGAAIGTDTACQEGGGYNLVVEVFNAEGRQLSERRVELGGGVSEKYLNLRSILERHRPAPPWMMKTCRTGRISSTQVQTEAALRPTL